MDKDPKNHEFIKLVQTYYNKSVTDLATWEYREALSFFTYSKINDSLSLSVAHFNKIVDSIINNLEYSWGDQTLTLLDEAEIQRMLRQKGYELKCFELDIFPKESSKLHDLLIKSNIGNRIIEKKNRLQLYLNWNASCLTPLLIIALFFADINLPQVIIVTYLVAAAISTLGHNYVLHDNNLFFKNKMMEFIGKVLLYFYVFDVRPGGKELHAQHHKLWRTANDPLVNDMRNNTLLYALSYPNPDNQNFQLLVNYYRDYGRPQPTFGHNLIRFRWAILGISFALWIAIFGFSNWISFYLIPLWACSILYSRVIDVIFHGPHTWDDHTKEKDYPWLMPLIFGSAYHITHHYYPNELYFGPGKVRYVNPEYWFTRLFFDTSLAKIRS